MLERIISWDRKTRFLLLNGIISLVILVIITAIPEKQSLLPPREFQEAAEHMERSIEIISQYCRRNNINMDEMIDPARTGLIGNELTEIMDELNEVLAA